MTNVTLLLDGMAETSCALVFRENITQGVYIYIEEAEAINGFEFWPTRLIEIERPASASINYEFIFRVPLSNNGSAISELIVNYQIKEYNGRKTINLAKSL